MRIISRKTLKHCWEDHRDAEDALNSWYKEAEHARWHSFEEIKQRYSSADPLPDHRVVFNIKGNSYRLIVQIHYNTGVVYIRFAGTHAEYDQIDAEKI
jgi:mRNA interferase HigB